MSTTFWKLDFPPSTMRGLVAVGLALVVFFQDPGWGALPFTLALGGVGGYFVVRGYRIAKERQKPPDP
jgi:hypothetical protein